MLSMLGSGSASSTFLGKSGVAWGVAPRSESAGAHEASMRAMKAILKRPFTSPLDRVHNTGLSGKARL